MMMMISKRIYVQGIDRFKQLSSQVQVDRAIFICPVDPDCMDGGNQRSRQNIHGMSPCGGHRVSLELVAFESSVLSQTFTPASEPRNVA